MENSYYLVEEINSLIEYDYNNKLLVFIVFIVLFILLHFILFI